MSDDLQPYLSPEYQATALAEFLAKHVKPYEPATDDYERPPFTEDIKEGKNDPIYNAHSYHTKVPPRSIIPYILHYTQPGDVVLDPFCGSGMTGVAAQMCANPPEDLLAQFPDLQDRVGPRACILNDLSPAACHIAYNYNTPVDVDALRREFERIKAAVQDEFDWLYGTEHYEPAVGLYAPKNPDVHARLKNPPEGAAQGQLLDSMERTWELLTRAEVESRLGYPVTELPWNPAWDATLARRASEGQAGTNEQSTQARRASEGANPSGTSDSADPSLARGASTSPDPSLARRASVLATVEQWVGIPATIQYTIWSDVYRCEGLITIEEPTGKTSTRGKNAGKPMVRTRRVARGCGHEILLWDAVVDKATGEVAEDFLCTNSACRHNWKKINLKRCGFVPVVSNYSYVGLKETKRGIESTNRRTERNVSAIERNRVHEISDSTCPHWLPDQPMDRKGPQYRRNALNARNIQDARDFYTARNRWALALLWEQTTLCASPRLSRQVQFGITAIALPMTRMYAYRPNRKGSIMKGSLYIPSLSQEMNVSTAFWAKAPDLVAVAETRSRFSSATMIQNGSARTIAAARNSVDYIFTDPPFGSNIYYSEASHVWEAWLATFTDRNDEAVVHRKNDGGFKRLSDYADVMHAAFGEMFRVLKPGRWATVEFNNSDGAVFEAIKEAIRVAGFEIVNMLLLDKEQKTFKQVKGAEGVEDVVDKDVLFNLHKPAVVLAAREQKDHDLEHQVTDAVRGHLLSLPRRIQAEPAKYSDEHRTTATINSMLMNSLIPRGVSVEQINLPFIERVCSRYFRKIGQRWYLRGEAVGNTLARRASEGTWSINDTLFEEEVIIRDSLSAIDWLRQKVHARPMLIGELKPLWMRAVGLLPADVSQTLSLDELLTENFWRDEDTNRWREPTNAERDRMNDDRSLRVLHDAERYVAGTLRRSTTDAERCDWIDILFKACRQVEEGDTQSTPTLRDFDVGEGYRVITRLFQSVLRDHVPADVFAKASKQTSAASRHVSGSVRREEQEQKAERSRVQPTLFD